MLKQSDDSHHPKTAAVPFEDHEALPQTSPTIHHHMSNSRRHAEDLTNWISGNPDDPAMDVCATFTRCSYKAQP